MMPVWRAHRPRCLGARQAINVVSSRGRRGHVPLTALRALDTPFPTALGLPQADTERVLLERLRALGGEAQRGVQLLSFTQARGPCGCAGIGLVLLERLRALGGDAQRGVQLLSFTQARGPRGSSAAGLRRGYAVGRNRFRVGLGSTYDSGCRGRRWHRATCL